jgi:hypothetical protein
LKLELNNKNNSKKHANNCWWEYKLIQPLWKAIWSLLKNLNINLPYASIILLLGIYPKECTQFTPSTCTPMCFCSTMHNSQVMETTQMPHYGWMDYENVVLIHNVVLLSHKKEWNLIIPKWTDGTGEHYTEWG